MSGVRGLCSRCGRLRRCTTVHGLVGTGEHGETLWTARLSCAGCLAREADEAEERRLDWVVRQAREAREVRL